MSLIVREAEPDDFRPMLAIYAHHVVHGLGTFDETPPRFEDYQAKIRDTQRLGLPWLVAELGGTVAGFAYATPFRPRRGYRYTVEDSVYILETQRRSGVGAALLKQIIERCEALGARQMVAVIGDSQNQGSIALHRKMGFKPMGLLPSVGFKHDRWVDIVFMQRGLNGGDASAPDVASAWRLE